MASTSKKKKNRSGDRKIILGPTGLIIAIGVVFLFLLREMVEILPLEAGMNPYLGAGLRLWVFAIFAIAAILLIRIKHEATKGDLIAVLASLCLAGIVLLGLKDTSYALNGISGDQGLLTAQVTKFASFSGSVDFAYKGLPAFYPPLYMVLLGKTAGLLAIEPYRMLKYGLIAIAFILPLLTRWSWRWIKPGSFPLAALLSLLAFQDWYKPFEWLALILFVPWWLYFVHGVGIKKEKQTPLWIAVGGLLGAALFTTYFYWFFVGAASLVVLFLAQRAGWVGEKAEPAWKPHFLVLGAAALFSLPYWGPLLYSMWSTGGWTSLQNLYFVPEFNTLDLPFFEFSVMGAVLLAGLAYLLVSFRRSAVSLGLLALLAGAYVWQILGYAAFLLGSSLLTFKAREFVIYVLALAAIFGAVELFTQVSRGAASRRRWGGAIVGGTAALALFFGQQLAVGFSDHELLPLAKQTRYPQAMVSAYQAIAADQGFDHVVLADGGVTQLSVYLPVYQFLSWAAVYSHPAGLYYDRVDFLQELSRLEDPHWFAAALMNNRYSHIDELILSPTEGGFRLGYLPEQFPASSVTEHIFFPAELFDPAYFSHSQLLNFVVFIPNYASNPLVELPDAQTYDPAQSIGMIGDGDDFYEFFRRFGRHVELPGQAEFLARLIAIYGP